MDRDAVSEQLSEVAALADPVRRELYLHVAAQPGPVSRDQAAEGVGVPRHTAKFHLDKLVEAGWLVVDYRRLSGRRGPGAGRPSKLYAPSPRQVSVSLPARQYALAAGLMAGAIDAAVRDGEPVAAALDAAARARGRELAAEVRAELAGAGGPSGPAPVLAATLECLRRTGWSPQPDDSGSGAGRTRLANCPFDALVGEHTELTCGMNLSLLSGLVDDLPDAGLRAVLEPSPPRCCVVLTAG